MKQAYLAIMRLAMASNLDTAPKQEGLFLQKSGPFIAQAINVLTTPTDESTAALPIINKYGTEFAKDGLNNKISVQDPRLVGLGGGSGLGFEIYCDSTSTGGEMKKLFSAGGGYNGRYIPGNLPPSNGEGGAGAEVSAKGPNEVHMGGGCNSEADRGCTLDAKNSPQRERVSALNALASTSCNGILFVTGGAGGGAGATTENSLHDMHFSWGCNFLITPTPDYTPQYPSYDSNCNPGPVLGAAYQMVSNGTIPKPAGCSGYIDCTCIPVRKYVQSKFSKKCLNRPDNTFIKTMCSMDTSNSASLRETIRSEIQP